MELQQALQNIAAYFDSGATQSLDFRKAQLQKLKSVVQQHEQEIYAALYADLKKSKEECWLTENGFLLNEINYAISNLSAWMKPEKVKTNLLNFPSKSWILHEPLGTVLIIGPWNYPFQLLLCPLVGAMAAGNCAVLKSSEFAPATSTIIKKIIKENFDQNYLMVVEGDGAETIPAMMNNFRFDHVFFTGSTVVGQKIYEMAAQKLTPVTLELGGKSPCVVLNDADIKVAARRIVSTKFSNNGQMCVAPDYVLVQPQVKEKLIAEMIKALETFYPKGTESSDEYGRIVNQKQFNRLVNYLSEGKSIYGGNYNAERLYFSPTLLELIDADARVMKDEIFGPILPVLSFSDDREALSIISKNKNPLAFYVFTGSKAKGMDWVKKVPSGGAGINVTAMHLMNHNLPFGGRGNSGMGNYHGRFSFETFSHKKAVMQTPTWPDPSMKYPPFKGKLSFFKKMFG